MRFKGLDLNLLVALDVLFQELSVTRAASRLNTTQSTVSGMLSRLRMHFQDELLIPYGRAMRKTALGQDLQGPLHEAILQLESLVMAEGSFDPSKSARHFKVEFPDHLSPVMLPSLTVQIARQAPSMTIEFSFPRGDPAPLLYRGELDLVVTPHSYRTPEYQVVPLLKDELVVVGWAGNPAMNGPIDSATLTSLPMISVRFDPSRVIGNLTDEQRGLIEGRGNLYIIAPTFSSIPRMLVESNAFALIHRNLANVFAKHLPIVIRPLPFNSPEIKDIAMYHPNRANDRGLMWLVDQFVIAAGNINL